MDFMMMGGAFDPASLGMDAAMVGAVNEMTNWVKERLDEWTWDDKFSRFYPAIPFLCAFSVCFLVAGMPFDWAGMSGVAKSSVTYGMAASFAWNAYRVSVKGE